MTMLGRQVIAEYGGLASDSPIGSFGDIVDRFNRAVPTEYLLAALGIVVLVYLVRKVF